MFLVGKSYLDELEKKFTLKEISKKTGIKMKRLKELKKIEPETKEFDKILGLYMSEVYHAN